MASGDESSGSSGGYRVNRRTYLGVVGGGATSTITGLAGCLGGDEDTLRVATWSGGDSIDHFRETITDPFEEETGISVEISPEWAEIISKIQSAPEDNPPYDVTVTSDPEWFYGDESELFNDEFDIDNVPNIEHVWPVLREEYRTERLDYGVPYGGFFYIMVYREDLIDFTPTEWSDILRSDVTEAGLDVGFWWVTLFVAALMTGELPATGELYNDEFHDEIIQTFERLDEDHISDWYSSGADFWNNLQEGINSIGGDYYHNSKSIISDYDNVSYSLPEPTTGDFEHYLAVRGTDEKMDTIEEFFNHMLDPEVQQHYHDLREQTKLPAVQGVETNDELVARHLESNDHYREGVSEFMNLSGIGGEALSTFEDEIKRITAG